MTVKQMADELKVSPQAIYQRLKKNNVDIKKLMDADGKELTEDGEFTIRKLFSSKTGEFKPTKQSVVEGLNSQISELRDQVNSLTERLKAAEAEVESLRKDKENLTTALDKAQDLHQQTLNRLLPPAASDPVRLSWKERLTGRRKA